VLNNLAEILNKRSRVLTIGEQISWYMDGLVD